MEPNTPIPTLEARVRLHKDESNRPTKLLAFAELTIAGAFVIKSIRIMRGRSEEHNLDGEPFVVFPAEKARASERWHDVAHPLNGDARRAAMKVILEAYRLVAGA